MIGWRRPQPAPAPAPAPAAVLGRQLSGEAVLPTRDGLVALPLDALARHMLVLGASGSGKTETLLRLAHSVAAVGDWQIFYVDGKGDERTMVRFASLMRAAGRDPRLFPNERYDCWRGDARDVANRLVEVIDFAAAGPAAYYRDLAVNVVRLACDAPPGPPRSSTELLERLRLPALEALYGGQPGASELATLTKRQVADVASRYHAFFGAVRGRLDGSWAFEDADCGYLLLDGLRLRHEAGNLARLLVEDFCQYAVARKPAERRVLLIVDDFSAIARAAATLVDAIERIRGAGAALVLAPQVLEGMGGAEAAARIVGSTHVKLVHAVPNPEPVLREAGTRIVLEHSFERHPQAPATLLRAGAGAAATGVVARERRVPKVDADEVRRAAPGHAFVICAGRAAKLAVERAPSVPVVSLPDPEPPPPPPPRRRRPPIAPIRP